MPYQLAKQKVFLVINPYKRLAFEVESLSYEKLGKAVMLDKIANLSRTRNRPVLAESTINQKTAYVEDVFIAAQKKFDITNEE